MSHIALPLMNLANQLRIFHWQTVSYGRHVASGNLICSVTEKLDKFMEVYQGIYGRIVLNGKMSLDLSNVCDQKIMGYLRSYIPFLQKLDQELAGHTDLLNLRDELIADINQTLYLFTFQ